jgi:3-deoxy-D-manno-octulosonic-acid transferase
VWTLLSFCYSYLAIPLLQGALFLASWVNPKARERRRGLKESWKRLHSLPLHDSDVPRFWFHAASLGEFESLKPIIERVQSRHTQAFIIVSFFSPSGYVPSRAYSFADAIVYLPLDSPRLTRRFLDLVQPTCAVISRTDIWWNYLKILHERGIPSVLVAARLNPSSILVCTAFGREYLRMVYGYFTSIYSASSEETRAFEECGIACITAADPRLDRIAAECSQPAQNLIPDNFFSKQDFVLVVGSSWENDEQILLSAYKQLETALQQRLRLVIVPHEPHPAHIHRLLEQLPQSQTLSGVQALHSHIVPNKSLPPQHIIVDSVGNLLHLYQYANAAYVGGGFGAGVHSVAEAAGYGLALACAPAIKRSPDAQALNQQGALTLVRTSEELHTWLVKVMTQEQWRRECGQIAYKYVHSSLGWSSSIADKICSET